MKRRILNILIILFPYIDVITSLLTREYNLSITPGIIVKGIFMLFLVFYVLISKSKYKKLSIISFVIFFLYVVGYFGFKSDLLSSTFIVGELKYLFRLLYYPVIFLGLLCFYDDNKFNKKELINLMLINLISFVLLLIIPLLFKCAFTTYPAHLKGYIGWFFAGNEVANIMILLCPMMYYYLSKSPKTFVILVIIYSILTIGTKVSLLGLIIVAILSFLYFLLKTKKIKSIFTLESLGILIIVLISSVNSYAVYNIKYTATHSYEDPNAIKIDDKNKNEVDNIVSKMDTFYNKNEILKTLLSSRDLYLANTLSIYDNDNSDSGVWFGIGFSNTLSVNNNNITKLVEIDVIDGFFHYGLLGLLIMMSPYLISGYLIIKSKRKYSLDSLYYTLILLLLFGVSCLSGHVFTAPAVSIYLVFYVLLLINEFGIMGRNQKLEDKISILSLHMGYGGIERSIVNQANMLSVNHDVEIVCLYKLKDENNYYLNKKVKLVYLSDMMPNKEMFLKYYHEKDVLKIFKEGFKSLKILYLKNKLVGDYIYNSNSKIIISTRLEFTKLLNKYYNDNSIRIAEEHVYHHENKKYICDLRKSLKHINYLIPASKYLTDDYKKVFKGSFVKVIFIPQTIEAISKTINKCNNKNIIAVGRLVKEKSYIDLIEVMRLISKKNKDIKLTIVGDGEQKNELMSLIKRYKLNNRIKLTGFLNTKELEKEYQKASLFVMTSTEESFGLVLLEAMSYGIPCFAFDSAKGAKELINNKNGLLIPDRDVELIADEIISYFDKNNHIKSKEALNVASKYTNDVVQKEWDDFITSISKKSV